jgi:hypothetical protein
MTDPRRRLVYDLFMVVHRVSGVPCPTADAHKKQRSLTPFGGGWVDIARREGDIGQRTRHYTRLGVRKAGAVVSPIPE